MKNLIVFMLEAALMFGLSAKGESKFRAEDYNPTIAQREGLAFLRIIGSPLSLFTEGAQYFNENKEATGDSSPIYFIVGMCMQGPFVTCFEAAGGVLELVSFQQFKSFAYPWEVDENDAKMVATIRENREVGRRLGSLRAGMRIPARERYTPTVMALAHARYVMARGLWPVAVKSVSAEARDVAAPAMARATLDDWSNFPGALVAC